MSLPVGLLLFSTELITSSGSDLSCTATGNNSLSSHDHTARNSSSGVFSCHITTGGNGCLSSETHLTLPEVAAVMYFLLLLPPVVVTVCLLTVPAMVAAFYLLTVSTMVVACLIVMQKVFYMTFQLLILKVKYHLQGGIF